MGPWDFHPFFPCNIRTQQSCRIGGGGKQSTIAKVRTTKKTAVFLGRKTLVGQVVYEVMLPFFNYLQGLFYPIIEIPFLFSWLNCCYYPNERKGIVFFLDVTWELFGGIYESPTFQESHTKKEPPLLYHHDDASRKIRISKIKKNLVKPPPTTPQLAPPKKHVFFN